MTAESSSLAEAARRLLRTDGCTLAVPDRLRPEAERIALAISDALPSLLREPQVISDADESNSWTRIRISTGEVLLAQIGGDEPGYDVCWVPESNDLDFLWVRFTRLVTSLIEAGYPGCVDCGGAEAAEPWDEQSRRASFSVNR